ncbi:hypothetical protein [Limnohabitans sp.]|jgi:hypothetical protein|uniref:hypothetical protein n=1 Tax=Limnohabitans sp. TaxID=1907725 RepID=UPI00391A08B5
MPKLDGTHILERLTKRIEQLEAGDEIADKEIRSLLNDAQRAELDSAWEQQQQLRKNKRARTEQEQQELGWKSKRQVRIEVLKAALATAWDGIEKEFERLQNQAEIRGAKIYFDTLNQALKDGKDNRVAENLANNAMTRAGLKRMDGQLIGTQGLTPRDREIRAMEDAILKRVVSEMDDYEREQYELSQAYDKAVLENRKKQIR